MDGADIVCVMPTGMILRFLGGEQEIHFLGGGKSLTYQLPALLTPGVTLVISVSSNLLMHMPKAELFNFQPLISLITDQILHLHEAGGNSQLLFCSSLTRR